MFLLALTSDKGECGRLLKQHGVARAPLEQAIAAVRGGSSVESAEAEGQRESLKKYCLDLTERARQGKLDPVIGATTRSAAPSRCCSAAPRITRC